MFKDLGIKGRVLLLTLLPTSLLALVQNDDQLASVIGHEIGHVVANHAAERASNQTVTSVGLAAVGGAAGR